MSRTYKGLPKSIKIGQREYRIHVKNEKDDPALFSAYAYTMTTYDNIVLSDSLSPGMARSSLLHEVLHAVGCVYKNGHATVEEKGEDESYDNYAGRWEHFFINLFEEPVVTLLRDNPKFVAFLTAEVGS